MTYNYYHPFDDRGLKKKVIIELDTNDALMKSYKFIFMLFKFPPNNLLLQILNEKFHNTLILNKFLCEFCGEGHMNDNSEPKVKQNSKINL